MEIREALRRMRHVCLDANVPLTRIELPGVALDSLAWSVADGLSVDLTNYTNEGRGFKYYGIEFVPSDLSSQRAPDDWSGY